MDRKQHIQKIREACIYANSDILKLQWGCKLKSGGQEGYIHSMLVHGKTPQIIKFTYDGTKRIETVNIDVREGDEYEVIGRDIRLADVLWVKVITIGGVNYKPGWDADDVNDIVSKWNLLKDRLEDQSDETLEFIYNLIKNI